MGKYNGKKEDSMGKYNGKKAVVTGGTHGMGLAIVKALLEGGAEVLLTSRNEQNLEAARRELEGRARVVRSDNKNGVSIISLGVMGSALARALLSNGHRVTVLNRTSGKAEPLVRDGAVLAPGVASAVSASPIVLVCVSDMTLLLRRGKVLSVA